MPGADLWVNPGSLPRPPRAVVPGRHRPGHRADDAGQHERRPRVPAESQQHAHRALHPQRPARDDRGHRLPERAGRRGLPDRQPGQARHGDPVPDRRARRSGSRRRGRSASTTRSSSATTAASPDNWFFSANYTLSRLYGNYSGLASSDEITHADHRTCTSATAQQQAGSIARPGGNVNRAWDLDELLWDSHGNLDVARPPRDRPSARREAVWRVQPAVRHAGRRVLLRRAAARRSRPTSPRPTAPTSVRQRPRRHGPHAGADAHRPARRARAAPDGHQEPAARAERAEPLQPEDDAAHLQLT